MKLSPERVIKKVNHIIRCSPIWQRQVQLRKINRLKAQDQKLHIGCGPNYLPGWINVDFSSINRADLIWDVTKGIPFESNSVRLIHSEDFLEHISLEHGRFFLQECYRVLVPGGVARFLTPNLTLLARQYLERDLEALNWYRDSFRTKTFAEMFNQGMRMEGHAFLYDEETLDLILKETGFEVYPSRYNQSIHLELCNLDVRGFGKPNTIYRDSQKPKDRI